MNYEDTANMDKLLVFLVEETAQNQEDQEIIDTISSEVKEFGWNKKLFQDLRQYIESLVPEGDYCYKYVSRDVDDETPYPKTETCPFWDSDPNQVKQENGYCHLLQHGDWEFNESKVYINCRTGEHQTANEIGLPLSLLWDQCKECDVNPDRRFEN